MRTTKDIGNIGETVTVAELTKRGIPVLTPIGDNLRYDLVFDYQNTLYKAQVKTCEKSHDGYCTFLCCSKKNHTTNKRLDSYQGLIDYFFYYCIDLDKLAAVPIEVVGNNKTFNLRITPPKNGMKANIHYFDEYSLDRMFS